MRLHRLENALKECHYRLQTVRITAAYKQASTNRLMTWQHDMTITSADMQDCKCCKSYLYKAMGQGHGAGATHSQGHRQH
jgi:hypothetical protein